MNRNNLSVLKAVSVLYAVATFSLLLLANTVFDSHPNFFAIASLVWVILSIGVLVACIKIIYGRNFIADHKMAYVAFLVVSFFLALLWFAFLVFSFALLPRKLGEEANA